MCLHPPHNEPREKRVLLVGIDYDDDEDKRLLLPRKDIDAVRDLFIDVFYIPLGHIIIMKDSADTPQELWPTKPNLERVIASFVDPDKDNIDYIFVFCGHRDQHDAPDGYESEYDGKDEYLICCDGEEIRDNYLKLMLVSRALARKSNTFTAILDACHSGTLLDLEHYWCNNESKIYRAIRRIIEVLVPAHATGPSIGVLLKHGLALTASWLHSEMLKAPPLDRPTVRCGFCRRGRLPARALAISACRDEEKVLENDAAPTSMTAHIVELLKEKPNLCPKELMRAIRKQCTSASKTNAEAAKQWLGEKKRQFLRSASFNSWTLKHAEEYQTALEVARGHKQHPQLSSDFPLRLSDRRPFIRR